MYTLQICGYYRSVTDRIELSMLYDELTPLQQLALETLASRHRLGHKIWTFNTNAALTKTLNQLASRGLISVMGGVVESTKRASLTQRGQALMLTPDYVPPIMQCPTSCDLDCDEPCHEVHQPMFKRDHRSSDCPSVRYLAMMKTA